MQNDNVNLQSSDEVSYDSLIRAKSLNENRENYYIKQLCSVIDDAIKRLGKTDLSVLEIGFNNGERLRALSEKYKDLKFTGLEVREKPVEKMKAQGFDCRLVDMEMFDEFFGAEEIFDVIYGFAVIHHMSDPYKSLESIVRLLKPGGTLIFIREGHPYDVVSHLHTTLTRNWQYEMNTFKMKPGQFKKLLREYSGDCYARYDNNGITPCFKRFNKVFCKLKLHRVPFWNGFTIFMIKDLIPAD